MRRLDITKRDLSNLGMVAFVVFLVLLALFLVARFSAEPQVSVQVGTQTFRAAVARSNAELEQGLSGTTSLAPGHAMLFVFAHDDAWAIWMKDMRYPIDVVWLDKDKTVVAIERNLQPGSYPNSYSPTSSARYVLEIPAGAADQSGITVDKTAVWGDNKT